MLNNNNSITQTVIMNDVLEMLPRQRNYILRLYPDPENIPVVEQTINTIGRSMSDGNGYLARRQSRLLEATENDLSQVIQPYSEDTLNNPSSVINSFLADLHNPRTFNLPEIDTTAAVDASEILLSFSNNMRENINNTNFQESIRRLTSNVLSHRQRFITELSEAYHNNNIGDYIRHRVNQDTDILNNIFDLFQTGLLENLFTVTNHVLNSGHNKAVILALILAFTKVFLRLGIFRFVFTYPAHMLVDLVRKIIDEILRSRIMRTSVNTFRNASQAGSAAEIREYSQRVT